MQKTTTCIGLWAEQIFSVNIWYICFFQSGCGFCVPVPYYFQKLQLVVVKKFWNSFCCIILVFVWAQKVFLRFLKAYFKLEILIYLFFVVYFLVDMFNWKAPFLPKKTSAVESETQFSTEALNFNVAKY